MRNLHGGFAYREGLAIAAAGQARTRSLRRREQLALGNASPPSFGFLRAARTGLIPWLLVQLALVALCVLLFDFVGGHDDEGSECDHQQRDGGDAVQLIQPIRVEVAIKQRQPGEHKEDVGAEDLEGGFAEGIRNGSTGTRFTRYFRAL